MNLGITNGSIVAFDVGYWEGLAETLSNLIKDDKLNSTKAIFSVQLMSLQLFQIYINLLMPIPVKIESLYFAEL